MVTMRPNMLMNGYRRTEALNINAVLASFIYSLPAIFQRSHIAQALHLHSVRWLRNKALTVNNHDAER